MIKYNDKYAKQNTKHKRKVGNSTILVSDVVVVAGLVVVAVVNSHQLFPHTQVYVGIGLGADRSGMVGYQGQSPGFAFRVHVVGGPGTSVAGGCVQLTKLCKLVIL